MCAFQISFTSFLKIGKHRIFPIRKNKCCENIHPSLHVFDIYFPLYGDGHLEGEMQKSTYMLPKGWHESSDFQSQVPASCEFSRNTGSFVCLFLIFFFHLSLLDFICLQQNRNLGTRSARNLTLDRFSDASFRLCVQGRPLLVRFKFALFLLQAFFRSWGFFCLLEFVSSTGNSLSPIVLLISNSFLSP